ncbi:hypothetical protein FA15DRAFT_663850 [Coprinopsis marcescibilis]|uniref:Nicotinamide N-methyltransferase n=1 Tax=Coprinopsis marcescibilis TaxID=230819 RepID=A0A5C3L9I8_COPMA|nr:hypothetical protein FA15DRAFT_663850 [Coprinopsis marcescibilis]
MLSSAQNLDSVIQPTDAEDILFESLETMFDLKPINVGSVGSPFIYRYQGNRDSGQYPPTTITLHTPDTLAANWSLHASAIWVSSIYLADHVHELDLPHHPSFNGPSPLRLLELGASAGLPGILTAKLFPNVDVTVSDYPDEQLIKTLSSNVELNNVRGNCRTVAYAWGSDVPELLGGDSGFDVVLAADTLWSPDRHEIFLDSLVRVLKRCPHARIHLVAGLHTGRYTIESFLGSVESKGLTVDSIKEVEVGGNTTRAWDVNHETNDDSERRRWVVWMQLRWHFSDGSHGSEQLVKF